MGCVALREDMWLLREAVWELREAVWELSGTIWGAWLYLLLHSVSHSIYTSTMLGRLGQDGWYGPPDTGETHTMPMLGLPCLLLACLLACLCMRVHACLYMCHASMCVWL